MKQEKDENLKRKGVHKYNVLLCNSLYRKKVKKRVNEIHSGLLVKKKEKNRVIK